jgi:peptidoglycan/LPS O-acetylase OafA/YrhL
MRSSAGEHYIALDHMRAVAAFMVFAWHFTHGKTGYPIPFEYVPSLFPLSLLAEGHTGVALFMTLSGYLFARLLDGKAIDYRLFLWNRVLRLLPLLAIVIMIVGIMVVADGVSPVRYAYAIASGVILPKLPNGGWSITAEFHFYLILPLFLWMLRRSRWLPLGIVAAAITLRALIHWRTGEVQMPAYYTIVGRIDQFVLGMLAWHFRAHFAGRHLRAAAYLAAFTLFYWLFDLQGGFFQNRSYPSPSPLWIVMPTAEGLGYAALIAWYDNSFAHSNGAASRFIGRIGTYSYSIYLLHFFFVFAAARFVHERVMDIANFYLACLWSIAMFLLMVPIGYLSFRFVESPFLGRRRRYILAATRR